MGMGKRLQIQPHSAEERDTLARMARSHNAQARQVGRATVVLAALEGEGVAACNQTI
ncbi:MAG: hypothetical protein ACLQUY_08655 [Ktedonobacterales bacterium]